MYIRLHTKIKPFIDGRLAQGEAMGEDQYQMRFHSKRRIKVGLPTDQTGLCEPLSVLSSSMGSLTGIVVS